MVGVSETISVQKSVAGTGNPPSPLQRDDENSKRKLRKAFNPWNLHIECVALLNYPQVLCSRGWLGSCCIGMITMQNR